MKYTEGQRVRIKGLDWYEAHKDKDGYVDCGNILFTAPMRGLCNTVVTIESVYNDSLTYEIEESSFIINEPMIAGPEEEEKEAKGNPWSPKIFLSEDSGAEEATLTLTEEYEFYDDQGNLITTEKIVIKKKAPEWPKTYAECSHILGKCALTLNPTEESLRYKPNLFYWLQKLLICRDTYWKIAGERMGLGKPWKPDWKDIESRKYVICAYCEEVRKDLSFNIHTILAFPTQEIRDIFYENFKDLIESCKELL